MASIFPDITVQTLSNTAINDIDYGKEISLDLINGEPTVHEGVEALKIWIEKAIRTTRYRWSCYSWDYGTEIDDLIGYDLNQSIQEREAERFIKEALLIDSRIKSVSNFIVNKESDKLNVSFTVITYLGDTIKQEVSI